MLLVVVHKYRPLQNSEIYESAEKAESGPRLSPYLSANDILPISFQLPDIRRRVTRPILPTEMSGNYSVECKAMSVAHLIVNLVEISR